MAVHPLRSIFWIVVRIGGLIALCLFLMTKAPSTVERHRLDMHGVVLGLDETGQVVGIELTEDVFYDEILEDISTLNSIWYVRLKQVSCSDELFSEIAGLPNLRSVSCRGCTISDKQLTMLQKLQLQMIDLGDTTGPRDGPAALGQQASLIIMAFDGCRWFADDDLRLLPSFPMLREIDISKTAITDDGLFTLEFCPKLGWVQLTGCSQLTGASLRQLQLCRGLKNVTMQDVPVSLSAAVEFQAARPDVNLSYDQLQNLPLTNLHLDRTALTDAGLETVSCLKMLRELDVSGTTISGTGFRTCSELQIYSINLEGVALSSEGLDAICQLKSLRGLNLQNAVLPENSWQSLGNKLQLHSVSLEGKSEMIQAFAQSENVARLQGLTLNRPDRNALRCIRLFPEVRFVRLLRCDVDEAAAKLIVLAQNCTAVELHECTISAEAMRVLASSETLQNIQLRNVNTTQIDTESLQLISSMNLFWE